MPVAVGGSARRSPAPPPGGPERERRRQLGADAAADAGRQRDAHRDLGGADEVGLVRTLAVSVWFPAESTRDSDAPVPSGPSRLELHAICEETTPCSRSVALAARLTLAPEPKVAFGVGLVIVTTGAPYTHSSLPESVNVPSDAVELPRVARLPEREPQHAEVLGLLHLAVGQVHDASDRPRPPVPTTNSRMPRVGSAPPAGFWRA